MPKMTQPSTAEVVSLLLRTADELAGGISEKGVIPTALHYRGKFFHSGADDLYRLASQLEAAGAESFAVKLERVARAIHEQMVYGNTDARALAEEALRAAGLSEDPPMPKTSVLDRMLDSQMEAHFSCAHEDVQLECPFCQSVVDEDTLVCLTCKEMVAPVRVCLYCEEEIPEPTPSGRTIPPHFHVWVETDRQHTDTGDWVKRCTICQHEV